MTLQEPRPSRKSWRGPFTLVSLLILLALWIGRSADHGGSGSSLHAGREGWLAARLYLEGRGVAVEIFDRPLDEVVLSGRTVALIAPFKRPLGDDELAALEHHLQNGGQLVYGYSGSEPDPGERQLQRLLDLQRPAVLRGSAPLGPSAFFAFHAERYTLEPAAESTGQPSFSLPAFAQAPLPPTDAQIDFRLADAAAVFRFARLRGEVVVLPAPLLANSTIADNLMAPEWLRAVTADQWAFHEVVHGVMAVDMVRQSSRFSWTLFVAQLLLIYLAALWALGRPFGPRLGDLTLRHGSAALFLTQLGHLHGRLGHHAEAAKLLVQRCRELDAQDAPERIPAELTASAEQVKNAAALLDLAKRLARTHKNLRTPATRSSRSAAARNRTQESPTHARE